MNRRTLSREIQNSQTSSFFLSFFLGQMSYYLKLVSITKIIESLSLSSYPLLMLVQGVIAFSFLKFCEKISLNSPRLFHILSFCMAGSVVLLAYHPLVKEQVAPNFNFMLSCFIFFASSNLTNLIDISVNNTISSRISLLKSPNISTYLTLTKEVGILSSAVMIYFFHSFFEQSYYSSFFLLFPFFMGFVLSNTTTLNKIPLQESKKEVKVDKEEFPFIHLMVVMMALMLIVKNIQSFAVLVGINELRSISDKSSAVLVSQITFIEVALTLLVIGFQIINKSKNSTWSQGFKTFFSTQTFSSLVLILLTTPTSIIASGILRKVIQHTYVDSSKRILMSAIPSRANLYVRNLVHKNVSFIFHVVMAIITAPIVFHLIPLTSLWFISLACCFLGLYFRKKLHTSLTEYQVASIVRTDIYEAAQSCYGLGEKESKFHVPALLALLHSNPRPFIAKAIIRSLGRIQDKRAIKPLMVYYENQKREDIQLSIVEALLQFRSHEVDLFLVTTLESIVIEQISLGQIRRNIFKAITKRVNHLAVPYLLRIINENKTDYRVTANAIIVLGEIALKNKDQELLLMLSHFLSSDYPRRVRSNALMFLYHTPQYQQQAIAVFETFLTSEDERDKSAMAYLAGELRIKSVMPFVYEMSESLNHSNSTLIISLLKQKHHESFSLFSQFLFESKGEDLFMALNQLSAIEDKKIRYQFYYFVLKNYPEKTNHLLDLLRMSQRDFDKDRQMIKKEAARFNIVINTDTNIFGQKRGAHLKKVA